MQQDEEQMAQQQRRQEELLQEEEQTDTLAGKMQKAQMTSPDDCEEDQKAITATPNAKRIKRIHQDDEPDANMQPTNTAAHPTEHYIVATPTEKESSETIRRPRERRPSTEISPTQPYQQQKDKREQRDHARQLPDPQSLLNCNVLLVTQQAAFDNAQGQHRLGDLVPGTGEEREAAAELIIKLQKQVKEQQLRLDEANKQLEAKDQKRSASAVETTRPRENAPAPT